MHSKWFFRGVVIGGAWFISTIALSTSGFSAPANVTTWHNDDARSGVNPNESVLSPSNVNATDFGKLFEIPVDGQVFAQPLYLSGVEIPGKGTHNVVYIATEHDSVYACDADDGSVLWHVTLLKTGETPSDNFGCTDLDIAEFGITATPIITGGVLYVQAMSKDSSGNYFQRLHGLDILTGSELFGGPVDIAATYPGTGLETVFTPRQHFDRAGLVLQDGVIYTTWSSICDREPYSGWVIGYDTSLTQVSVLNLTPNGSQGSIWASGAAPAADSNGHLFVLTGNGTFDTSLDSAGFPLKRDFGNCFLNMGLATDGALTVSDYFTPFDTIHESEIDLELGSGGTILLPDMNDAAGNTRHLVLGGGKDGHIYIADRDNMGKFNPDSNANIYQDVVGAVPNQIFSTPAFFNSRIYYAVNLEPLKSFQFVNALLDPVPLAVSPTTYGFPGATPAISANGIIDGMVWTAEYLPTALLHAYDADDVSKELYNSNQAPDGRDQFGVGNKFVVPTIANGKVYVGTKGGIGVFGLFDPPHLANLSARTQVGTGDNVLIGGFIIQGSATHLLVIRGIGPSISVNGSPVAGTLQDPVLDLYNSAGALIATNDNWGDSSAKDEIAAVGLAPTDPRESAILPTLNPGSYTAILRGVENSTGIGLLEIYDITGVTGAPISTLPNLSSRGFVGTGDDVLIGGLIVAGVASQNVILRAIGPDLASRGVNGSLMDPVIELHDVNGVLLASNDNWRSDQEAEIIATGLQPADDRDAAIVRTLPPGSYTTIVYGAANSTGVALVETYALH
jgi:outer membrane protein assembly factor BamB